MSVKIRLSTTGKTHQISYRIVAQDTHTKRGGKFLEILGFWNPKNKTPKELEIKKERVKFWIEKGAKPTAAVSKLIEKSQSKDVEKNGRTA